MAAPVSCFCSSSSLGTTSHLFPISSQQSYPKASSFHLSSWFSQLGSSRISPYNGLKHMGIPISQKSTRSEKKGRFKSLVVHASLFGVGAPEALVIGVVALLVFGPKGLAEVARNLGKTLRAFQPTIRELQDVSREFKSTLEREIGLDDISNPTTYSSNRFNPEDPNGAPSGPSPKAYTSEDYLKMTEEQLKAFSNRGSETQNQAQEQPDATSVQTTSGENQSKPPPQP